MPVLHDVQWDFQTAEMAVTALRRMADSLDNAAYQRALYSRESLVEWQGQQRTNFDDRMEHILRRAVQLAAELRHVADQIAMANQRCHEEQVHREQLRKRG
jgi:uncharacterized protein YukE